MERAESDRLVRDREAGIERLLEIMARLRDRHDGCPWDLEQSFATIAPYTLEEAHEVADAIAREAWGELKGELGDLLFQAVYHAQLAEEKGYFDFQDVVRQVSDKMLARHPHVFGDAGPRDAKAQTLDWERLKAEERAARAEARVLDGVALALPALSRAVKLQNRAARVGFDWPETTQVLDKLLEESRELVEAKDSLPPEKIAEEMGDLLFVMANLARHLGVDPEAALRGANDKFIRRFNYIEDVLHKSDTGFEQSSLEDMDALWNEAKRLGL